MKIHSYAVYIFRNLSNGMYGAARNDDTSRTGLLCAILMGKPDASYQ